MHKALAYTGLAWLNDLGDFESNTEAMDALEAEYERQLPVLLECYSDVEAFELFWADCRIDEI